MDVGIQQAARQAPATPLPSAWLGRAEAPIARPDWAVVSALTAAQQKNLLAQIAYNLSGWDYAKVSANNELGRYQFDVKTLESYGLLTAGSYDSYGTDAVNYQHCWRAASNSYAEYLSEVESLQNFLTNKTAQEYLAYQRLVDLYNDCLRIGTIKQNDTADVIAGMLYTAWTLGVGTAPTINNTTGTGAYAWRHYGVGTGAEYYNSGRYSAVVLSTSTASDPLPTKEDIQSNLATPEIVTTITGNP